MSATMAIKQKTPGEDREGVLESINRQLDVAVDRLTEGVDALNDIGRLLQEVEQPVGKVKKCEKCGKPYLALGNRSKFCSTACRVAAYKERKAAKEEPGS